MSNKINLDLPKDRRRKAQIERILDTAMKIVTGEGGSALTLLCFQGSDYCRVTNQMYQRI